ncbi:MAG: hypothetical protein M1827_005223 [Pycnora praestabilis]|nr:MAG: hypothetical protein M1827_005223 [Pycnora praestabilis]
MRLFLLPISTRRSLIYGQRINQQLSSQQNSYLDRITNKAAEIWVKWEKGDRKWQKLTVEFGNKALQKISYQEWGLKSIPPLSARRKAEELEGKGKVEVCFPRALFAEGEVMSTLRKLATDRQSLHRKRMWGSLVAMPLTAPLALIPIMPNIPFFYLVYRAWSHWRAFSGSRHVEFLLDRNLLKESPSEELNLQYMASFASLTTKVADRKIEDIQKESKEGVSEVEERLILQKESGRLIAQAVGIPEIQLEVERAVKQVGDELKAKRELKEEKLEPSIASARSTEEVKQ